MLIVGSHVSPYVRKVLVALAIKGIAHEVDPITPFYGNDDFSRLSPLRRIPVLIGSGIPLFGALPIDIPMHHVRTRVLGPGLVQSDYDLSSPG